MAAFVAAWLCACGGGTSEPLGQQAAALTAACKPSTPEEIVSYLDHTNPGGLPPTCDLDSDCPCGMYCHPDGFCDAECVTGDTYYVCSDPTKTCNGVGKCAVPGSGGGGTPAALPILTVTPATVSLPADGADPGARDVTVTLSTDDTTLPGAPARQPTILVRGSLASDPDCEAGGDPAACTMSFATDLEVSCAPGAPFKDECTLAPPYTFSGTGTLTATRTIQVRARTGAPDDTWQLRFFGERASGLPTRISVERGGASVPFSGVYEGEVALATASADLAVRLPVRAYAAAGQVVLVDAARVIAPSGKLRLPLAGGAQRVPWLVSGTTTQLVAEVTPVGLVHDTAQGRIAGNFTVTLPGLVPGAIAAPLTWHLTLARRDALVAPACGTGNTCAAGATCDEVLGRCLPGDAFVTAPDAAPVNVTVDPGLHDWDGRVAAIASPFWNPLRVTPDGVERLLCENGARLGTSILPISGELSCAPNGGGSVVAGAVRLALLRDSGIGLTLEDTYKKCLEQLTDTSQTTTPRECVALWRFHPSLLMLLDTALGSDPRGGRLLQMDLRQWASAHAFLAGQALELARLGAAMIGGTTAVDVPKLLDRVGAGLRLFLDGELTSGLARLDPETLRHPDYRYSNRPWSYLAAGGGAATTMTDVEAGHNLSASSDYAYSGWIQPNDNPFAGDYTVTWKGNFDLFKPGPMTQWKARDIGLDYTISGAYFYEPGYRRNDYNPNASTSNFYERDGYNWYQCLESCVSSQYCLAWSWRPAQGGKAQRCSMHTTLTGPYGERRAVSDGSISGLVRYGYDSPPCSGAACGPGDTFTNTDYSGPDSTVSPTNDMVTCRTWCTNNASCLAWTFTGTQCRMKYGPLPLPTTRTGYTSGLSARGHKINSVIADQLQNGTTYFGAALESFTGANWDACHQRCMDRSDCNMWSFGKTTRTCTLRATGRILPILNGNDVVSGVKPVVSMELRRRTSYGHFERFYFPLTQATRALFHGASYTLVHKAEEHRYLFYVDNQPVVERTYTTEPAAPPADYDQLEVTRNTTDMTTRQVNDLAIFKTALDDQEIAAILQRRQWQQVNPVTGNTFRQAIPVSSDHDEARGLPVAMLEALEVELGLLTQHVDAKAGSVADECRTSSQTQRAELLARTGEALRRGLAIEAVADDLTARASHVGCTSDAACASVNGVCGPPQTKITVPVWDTATGTRTGTMRQCLAFWDAEGSALCAFANSGNGSSGDASPGQARFAFEVPKAGTYNLWGRAATRDGSSFWVSVDDEPWQYWGFAWRNSQDNPSWSWQHFSASYNLSAGTHSVRLAVADDGTMLRELLFTTVAGDASPSQTRDVCYDPATGAAVVSAPPWADDFHKAKSALAAARATLGTSVSAVATCKNPLGIEDADLPLYFKDVLGDVSRYFAASDFLFTEADAALGRATTTLAAAQSAWLAEKNAQYQAHLDETERDNRIAALESTFEAPLSDLCGVYVANPGDLLDSFASGSLTTPLCFVQPGPYCATNAGASVENADQSCYRGQIGESLLSMKSAWLRMTAAQQIYDTKQADVERAANVCAMRQDMQASIEKHYRLMRQLREERKAIGIIGGMFKGIIMLATAAVSAEATGVTQAQGLDAFGTVTSLGFNLWEAHVQGKIDDEEFAFKELMDVGAGKIELQECLNEVASRRDGLVIARTDIAAASNDFQTSAMRFANLRRKTEQLVAQGLAERAREISRAVPRPQAYFWLDDAVNNYRRELGWARRVAYLALRAIEYDTQQSLGLRSAILGAQNPTQLGAAMYTLRQVHMDPHVFGQHPSQDFFVVRLGADLLGFTGDTGKAKLRAYVTSPAQTFADGKGKVYGQGIRFFLTPEVASGIMDIPLENRCGERIWTVSAQVHTSQSQRPVVATVRIYKRNGFSSQWCTPQPDGSERQLASIRPWNNLFGPTSSTVPPKEQPDTTPADLQATVNGRTEDMYANVYDRGTVEDFAARGLYGEYLLAFPKDTLIDLTQLDEVYLRFDYLSVPSH